MRWSFSESSQYYEQYDLDIHDDGTFSLSVGYSDPAGWAGGYDVSGRWTQAGADIEFTILERSSPYGTSQLTTATLAGERLEVTGIGAFWKAPP